MRCQKAANRSQPGDGWAVSVHTTYNVINVFACRLVACLRSRLIRWWRDRQNESQVEGAAAPDHSISAVAACIAGLVPVLQLVQTGSIQRIAHTVLYDEVPAGRLPHHFHGSGNRAGLIHVSNIHLCKAFLSQSTKVLSSLWTQSQFSVYNVSAHRLRDSLLVTGE